MIGCWILVGVPADVCASHESSWLLVRKAWLLVKTEF
jgi:hypothetical protein